MAEYLGEGGAKPALIAGHGAIGVGLPPTAVMPAEPKRRLLAGKYVLDRILAVIGLILSSPVLLLLAIAVLVTLGRPIVIWQRRAGMNGQEFRMLKFRTLLGEPDGGGQPMPARIDQDVLGVAPLSKRNTRLGMFMRRFALDELPQLLNVARGEMALIGPRPELAAFATAFAEKVDRYEDRFRVRPGITGWAQVNGLRGMTPIRDRVELDNHYIENWSPWFDLKILLLTIVTVVWHGPDAGSRSAGKQQRPWAAQPERADASLRLQTSPHAGTRPQRAARGVPGTGPAQTAPISQSTFRPNRTASAPANRG